MITIGKPFIYEENGKTYLKAAVKVSEDTANKYAGLKKQMGKIYWRVSENYPPEEWKDIMPKLDTELGIMNKHYFTDIKDVINE